jgi:hypothetical protein
MYYKECIGAEDWHLDEDVDDIDAVRQQMLAIKRLIQKLQLRSKAAKTWQADMIEQIDGALHDTSTEWLIENGRYLVAVREPY